MANKKKKERICIDCGDIFVGYPPAKRCSMCAQTKYQETLANRRKNTGSNIIACKIICTACGAIYESPRPAKYCAMCAITRTREYHRRVAGKYHYSPKAEGYERVCKKCQRKFVAKTPTKKLCYDCFAEKGHKENIRREKTKRFQADKCIYPKTLKNGKTVYKACISQKGKPIHLGYFSTKEEAIRARVNAYRAYIEEDKHD